MSRVLSGMCCSGLLLFAAACGSESAAPDVTELDPIDQPVDRPVEDHIENEVATQADDPVPAQSGGAGYSSTGGSTYTSSGGSVSSSSGDDTYIDVEAAAADSFSDVELDDDGDTFIVPETPSLPTPPPSLDLDSGVQFD